MEYSTGYVGKNKQGLEYEILDGKISKRTKIKFSIDGAEVVTTKQYLSKGLPMHPTYGKMQPGDIYKDNKGNSFALVKKVKFDQWSIKYEKDGVEVVKYTSSIKDGSVKHPTDNVITVGDKFKVTTGVVTVVKYNSASDVDVVFEDGSTQNTTASCLRLGNVGHPTSNIVIGEKFKTRSGWGGEVIEYIDCRKVKVKWQDGSFEYVTAKNVKDGSVKPLTQPSVCDVGYFGQGRFSPYSKKEGEKAPEEVYRYWVRMLTRCFGLSEISKSRGKWYVYTEVHNDWFCFQNFAEWALKQPNWNLKYELDKDLLGNGNKYSPEFCTFLPEEVNIFLCEGISKKVHDLPIGVQYIKPGSKNAKVGYVARCFNETGREYLGYFDDPFDGYKVYKEAKEKRARYLALKYKDTLTELAFDKLYNYQLNKIYPDVLDSCVQRNLLEK